MDCDAVFTTCPSPVGRSCSVWTFWVGLGMLSVAGEVTGALQTWKESESCFPSGNLAPGNCLLCFYRLEGWMLVRGLHRPGSNRGLQTSTGWIIIHPWRQLQRGWGGQPEGGASSQGSLTFQETGLHLSHPPSSSNWWHNKGWMGRNLCSTSSTLKLCVHEQNAAKGLQIEIWGGGKGIFPAGRLESLSDKRLFTELIWLLRTFLSQCWSREGCCCFSFYLISVFQEWISKGAALIKQAFKGRECQVLQKALLSRWQMATWHNIFSLWISSPF